jgi:hypothetical protein
MKFLKDLERNFKSHHLIGLLALIFVVLAVSHYSNKKGMDLDTMDNNTANLQMNSGVQAANPLGDNETPSTVPGGGDASISNVVGASCTKQPVLPPGDLLPKDNNNEWAKLNPTANGGMAGINLLQAGSLAGINTVGSSLRNANLQVRSEPPNPQVNVSPWSNTTIEPDLMRTPLELGCGPQ